MDRARGENNEDVFSMKLLPSEELDRSEYICERKHYMEVQIEDFVWARRVQKAKCPLELDPVLKGKKTEERLQKIIKRLRSAPHPHSSNNV